ncbi:MAG: zinc ribbon domain-containing protein, partial [Burkholderiaceae bacterium]|nr:zinc ribbon domain-containing protein [Burkholderiaceae bacterium]
MSYCPNCNHSVDVSASECSKCGAIFGNGGWLPSSQPIVPTESLTGLTILSNLLLGLGHLFLFGFPVLFVVLHVFFYSGGGTSGIPLFYSMTISPVFYLLGVVVRIMERGRDA